jgi:hypothetical protein
MERRILMSCECEGTGFVAVEDNGGDGIEHLECGQHHPTYQDAPSIDEPLAHIANQTGISSEFFNRS